MLDALTTCTHLGGTGTWRHQGQPLARTRMSQSFGSPGVFELAGTRCNEEYKLLWPALEPGDWVAHR